MKRLLVLIVAAMLAFAASAQGSQPYSKWYGLNKTYNDNTQHSEVEVLAPYNSDVIVIIRHNNKDGRVAGHRYIRRGTKGTIQLANGVYQVFFYYGTDWSSQLDMGNGIRGGFSRNVQYSKDNPQKLYNNILTYELLLQRNGNFSTKPSNKNEVF